MTIIQFPKRKRPHSVALIQVTSERNEAELISFEGMDDDTGVPQRLNRLADALRRLADRMDSFAQSLE